MNDRSSVLIKSPRDTNVLVSGPIDNDLRSMKISRRTTEVSLPLSSSEDDEPPTPPPKDDLDQSLKFPSDVDSYFSSFKASRTNSIYSLSRISFANQLSQLTSLKLPNASSLSTSISSIPTAPEAVATFSGAAEQIRRWLQKASEVLVGLDAEDDVEWAAAGGREGLGEVDTAIGKFEGLIGIYVTAIEDLQARVDISKVPPEELKAVVDRMEQILKEWENVRKLLKGVKGQVELAMEWGELWNVVLGDIGLEMENLSRLVFEMEETRHKALLAEPSLENGSTLDMQELETIVEEAPTVGRRSANHRFSLPPAFAATSPITSPGITNGQEDSSLLALFARMQPLRASLDFLPMTLSNFGARASDILPTACEELEARRKGLEKKWKKLENDAEGLRRELGEDRWVLVFRNAGRQAQKLCESVERSISKLQESIDVGAHHSNPPILAKKIESYEAKKLHYGPAIERVLAIIEKGVNDRLTVNGEILRLHSDTRARWTRIESEMKDMDVALDYLNITQNQQFRDSVSSIVSMDRSVVSSAVDTPRSSPASSVVMGPSGGHKTDIVASDTNGAGRRNSSISSNSTRPNHSRRYFSMPPGSAGTILPRQLPIPNSVKSDRSTPQNASPSLYSKHASSTPTPGSRPQRPTTHLSDNKPRWNSSSKVDHIDFSLRPKPAILSTPSPNRKSPMSFRSHHSGSYSSSNVPLPSPLGRSDSSSPAPNSTSSQRSRISGVQTAHENHDGGQIASSPARAAHDNNNSRSRPNPQLAPIRTPSSSSRGQRNLPETQYIDSAEDSSPSLPKSRRPTTALANGRRLSMLPIPKTSPSMTSYGSGREFPASTTMPSGRESVIGPRNSGRESVIGPRNNGRESVIGIERKRR